MDSVARTITSAVTVLIVVGVSLVADRADAAVLCRKRSGRVVVAEACRRRQTRLTAEELAFVGPTGSAGAAGAPGDPGVLPYRLVDAMGQQVGIVLRWLGFRIQVVLTHPALPIPIQLEVIDGLISQGASPDSVRYVAPGCTGTPFISEGGSLLPLGQLVGDTLYYATEENAVGSFESVETEDAICSGGAQTVRGTCCRAQSVMTSGAAATALPLATLGITEPFTLEPRS